jgi:hypothetical protein
MRILVTGKSDSQLSLKSEACYLGDHAGGVHDPSDARHTTQGELQRFENNYKTLNLITTTLVRNMYDHVSHLETTHEV